MPAVAFFLVFILVMMLFLIPVFVFIMILAMFITVVIVVIIMTAVSTVVVPMEGDTVNTFTVTVRESDVPPVSPSSHFCLHHLSHPPGCEACVARLDLSCTAQTSR